MNGNIWISWKYSVTSISEFTTPKVNFSMLKNKKEWKQATYILFLKKKKKSFILLNFCFVQFRGR